MADIAINPVVRRVQFTGNTGLGPFAFTFNILQNTDIIVYKNTTLLTLTTDYTVTINANGTGSVTLTGSGSGTALIVTDNLTIIGGRELSRTTDFVTAGDLLASSLNEQLDSNVIMSQQLDERFSRTISVSPGDADKTLTLPTVDDRKDKILKFDTEGNVEAAAASTVFANTVVGANFTNNVFTGDGSTVAFTTTVAAGSKNNCQVYIDGVYQEKASFSINATTLTFTEAPPLNASIEVIIGNAIETLDADSGNINYNQGGTGAQTRTVESKLQEFVSVKDFGAVGDGVTDDTAALQAMVSYVNSIDRVKVLFNGYFKTTQKLSFTCPNLHLEFEVRGKDGLLCSNCDGIEVTHTGRYDNFSSRNMLLVTDANKLYTGFKYTNTAASTGDQPIKKMEAPTFIGKDRHELAGSPYEDGWLTALRVDNGDRFFVYTPWIQGAEQDRIDEFPIATKGVYGSDTTHLVLHDPQIFVCETGIEIDGQSEGCEILGGAIVANRKGINFNPTGTPANDTNIRGTHIASMDYNINIGGGTASTVMHDIEGCLLFTRTESYVSSTFKHIIVDGQTSIRGNFFFTATGITPTNHIGVNIVQPPSGTTYNVQVLGNLFYRIPTITQIASGVLNTLIANNSTRDDGVTILASPVSDSGTGTTIGLNYGDRDFGEVKSDTGVFWSAATAPAFYVGTGKNKALSATQGSVSAVNYLDAVNAATGDPVLLRAQGDDTNIDLKLLPKGTGRVHFGVHSTTADTAISGYIEIVDSTGAVRKLAVIT